MQLNVTIDDELHKSLLAASKARSTTLPELARSALRAYHPDPEKLKIAASIRKKDAQGLSTFEPCESIVVEGQISEFHLAHGNYWCGTVKLTSDEFKKICGEKFMTHIEISVVTENGRQGGAVIVGMNSDRKGMSVQFAGTSTLS